MAKVIPVFLDEYEVRLLEKCRKLTREKYDYLCMRYGGETQSSAKLADSLVMKTALVSYYSQLREDKEKREIQAKRDEFLRKQAR